jgi:3-oxoacyl-[acyl-carrier-protein] synthase II
MEDGMKAGASVTGLGATTPLGGDVVSTWAGMLEGRSGITLIEEDWVEIVRHEAACCE